MRSRGRSLRPGPGGVRQDPAAGRTLPRTRRSARVVTTRATAVSADSRPQTTVKLPVRSRSRPSAGGIRTMATWLPDMARPRVNPVRPAGADSVTWATHGPYQP
ncbi:hypothetical protein SMD44_07555 [Streptomyces alboflavus]|uniref:Uncharacterized protein n=1 Tax=Streptomyces alboflavus TaxID=67267 RepID=A0A1Z1WNS1_9ACTN|nr:hypothetical protein SMD44_07555 [Streptomyces alboflavus]